MAAVLKVAVVALAIIAVEQQLTAADDGQQPNIKEFLEKNLALLTIRTTRGTFNQCQWYKQLEVDASYAVVSVFVYIENTKRMTPRGMRKKWTFEGTDMMWSSELEGDREEKRLLYQNKDATCGVLQYDEMYEDKDIPDRRYYELVVNEKNMLRVPEDCKDFYLKKIGNDKETIMTEDALKACKFLETS
ncbi:uncharacterized protein LOC119373697 [Rhipicephalus sanguineus]|uniref:uncharacterized protein LOC119373697 n=1 Tax=Rhipicephalus sanguineus TaxID=34632 RepID=UPI00189585F6|nr:uncharacterized protein LOC119373697 [Rhipicephalus sanguineus]